MSFFSQDSQPPLATEQPTPAVKREGAEDVAKVVAAAEHREVATENLSTSTVGRLQPLAPVFGDQRFDRHEVESTILKLDQDLCGYVSALMPCALVDSLVRMTNVYAAEKLQNAHLKPKSRLRCWRHDA